MDQCQQYFDKFQNEKTFLEMFPDLSFVKYTTQKIIEEIASGQSRACLSYVSTQCFIRAADSPQAPGLTAALTLASPAGSLHMLFPPLFLALAWFGTGCTGFHRCQRQRVAVREVSQSNGGLDWLLVLAFRILGQKQEQLGLVPYSATNGIDSLNIYRWFSQGYQVMTDESSCG